MHFCWYNRGILKHTTLNMTLAESEKGRGYKTEKPTGKYLNILKKCSVQKL